VASRNENPATGDRGVRQKVQHSGQNAAGLITQYRHPPQAPARADPFGARQAARAAAFMARHRAAAPAISAGAPPRTISGVRP
jgi:hypothetical protein